jgi:hypothetical protein
MTVKLTGKDVKGSGLGLIEGIIPALIWGLIIKHEKFVRQIGVPAKIRTTHHRNIG